MKHELKIKPEYLAAIYSGEKTFEIRNNSDRNFQVGDTLLLKGWDGEFTGDFVEKVISYITDFEQKPGNVVLGLVGHREHALLEKFHRTGVAIERAISTGSVLADHPLKSRLELLANHHKQLQELTANLERAERALTRAGYTLVEGAKEWKPPIGPSASPLLDRIDLLTAALGEARDGLAWYQQTYPEAVDGSDDEAMSRIDAALAGKLPELQNIELLDASAERNAMQRQRDEVRRLLERECDDADAILRLICIDPLAARTDGGSLNIEKISAMLAAAGQRGADAAVLAGKVPECWRPIETAPKQVNVLIHYKNECGKGRTIKARYVPRYTEEITYQGGDIESEYLEETDQYFLVEGWIEQIDNWGDFSGVYINYQPTHWMPLPAAPVGGGTT